MSKPATASLHHVTSTGLVQHFHARGKGKEALFGGGPAA
jgi:hypothetical protein